MSVGYRKDAIVATLYNMERDRQLATELNELILKHADARNGEGFAPTPVTRRSIVVALTDIISSILHTEHGVTTEDQKVSLARFVGGAIIRNMTVMDETYDPDNKPAD